MATPSRSLYAGIGENVRETVERVLLDELQIRKSICDRSAGPSEFSHLEQYISSVREFNDFVLHGIFPKRLQHLNPDNR